VDILRDVVAWTASWANTPYGLGALFAIAFAESSFFPVPPDVLMIPMALAQPHQALVFAAVALAGSLLGGILGFFIGLKGGRPILKRFFSEDKIALVQDYYQRYDVWAVGVAGFTPIPYKLFSISAGAFELDFKRFMLASLIGRGGRFFLVGLVIMVFGEPVKELLDKYFDLAAIAIIVLFIGGFWVIRVLSKRAARQQAPASPAEVDNSPNLVED